MKAASTKFIGSAPVELKIAELKVNAVIHT